MGPGNYGFFPVHFLLIFLASLFGFYKGKNDINIDKNIY